MTFNLPKPSLLSLVLQCTLVLFCAGALYLVLSDLQMSENYKTAIDKLTRKSRSLDKAYQKVDRYMDFVDSSPYYQHNLGEPQWEKVDETWSALSYSELLIRLDGLYRKSRPFVLDFFSAAAATQTNQEGGEATTVQTNRSNPENRGRKELTFHLQGYFLCPCQ